MKKWFCVLLLISSSLLLAQSYAVDKGAVIIEGTAGYMSQSGDWYENEDGDKSTTITLNPTIMYFISPNIGIGGSMLWHKESQGDASQSYMSLGPALGYFAGNSQSTNIPFLFASYQFQSMGDEDDSIPGKNIVLGAGMIFVIREHLGISAQISYQMESWKHEDWDEAVEGTTLGVQLGIAGLLF
jgi:hypothetical protein